MPKTAEYFRGLPYSKRVRIERDGDGPEYFVAYIEELDGVQADGETELEARRHLQDAFDDYVAAMLEWGDTIPEPQQWPLEPITPEAIRAARAQLPAVRNAGGGTRS